MDCYLCYKEFSSSKPPVCPSCAQTILYAARVRHADAILAREKVHNHAEAILRPGNDGVLAALSEDTDLEAIATETQKRGYVQSRAKAEAVRQKIEDISANSKILREQIDQYKEYRHQQKTRLADRWSALQDLRRQLDMEKARVREPILATIKKVETRLEKVQIRTAEARLFLCHQVAILLDLKRVKTGAEAPSEYWLAGSPIPNLRHLCRPTQETSQARFGQFSAPHEALTASLENVCRLLTLCCHYLSVRLPAEIAIPAGGVVRYTVLPERSSYQTPESKLKNTGGNLAAASTRSLARVTGPPRARTLYLDRTLQALSNDDIKGFQLLIESVMLLGWDIAWLSRTQGIESLNNFEDVCAMGRNLYNLFVRNASLPRRRPVPSRMSSATPSTTTSTPYAPANLQFGTASHGSAHHAIHSVQGQSILSSWRFGTSTASSRLIDKLSNYLLAEMSRQEWDTIDEHEWDDEREDEQAVLVGGHRKPRGGVGETPTSTRVVAVGHGRDPATQQQQQQQQQRGQNGWMKVRDRVT